MKRLCLFLLLSLAPWLALPSAAAPQRVVTLHTVLTELCREIGVNRTQFNRYLSGNAFPRPDVL